MPAKSSPRRHAAAVVGALQRHHGPAHPRLTDARRDLRAAELEEHVRRIVDDAPPLTAEQRDKIAALLRAPVTRHEGEAAPSLLSRGVSRT